ncbi:MAG: AEC family transporter [Rhodocyclaceae bacterium]|nr:AEC family transporter [Rhodocyclaceae bacterium]MCP5232448.1 AEC family transporter [Zoogloeaceae bacterium]MCP5240143.1 AEC family transporter [Zoogloeaceae bacterium]MCP5255982.1 AEC family transporter [Zoogloeaceae bacterium]MCP5293978.1 AEC family transporter [Zoogloeaceae bacterium]
MQTFLLLLPDFSLILLGAALRRYGGFADGFWSGLEKLVYFVLFPALLFSALARATLDLGETAPLVAAGILTMLAGFLLVLAARPWMGLTPMGFASRLQCGYRFNTYIGFAVAGKVHGLLGLATMGTLCGAMVPFANIAAVAMLARHGQGRLWRELSRNPLVLATFAGLIFNLSGLSLPAPAGDFLKRLADASIALGLLAVGAALRIGSAGGHPLGSAWIVVVKLLLLPLVAWLLARQFGIGGVSRDVLVIFAALPSASSAYILAMRMGGDGQGVAWLISATTLLALVTLTAWVWLLGGA